MNRLLLSGIAASALLISVGSAFAADPLPMMTTPVVVAEPAMETAYDWTGAFIGVQGGMAVRQFAFPFLLDMDDEEIDDFAEGAFRFRAGGFVAGGGGGFNFQTNSMVFGVLGDINWSGFKAASGIHVTTDYVGPTVTFDGDIFAGVDWYGTLRARAGFTTGYEGRMLVYGTGGLAYGQTRLGVTGTVSDGGGVLDEMDNTFAYRSIGWTVGGGVEFAFSDRLTFKTEYLFVNLGTETLIDTDFTEPDGEFALGVTTRFHTLQGGLNFHF